MAGRTRFVCGATTTTTLAMVILLSFAVMAVQAAVDPIVIKGSHFFYQTNGSQFFIRGVAYQDQGHFSLSSTKVIDPFADGPTCQRDIPYLQALGVNVVRAYVVDPKQDHSECMQHLANAGIYVLTDLAGIGTQCIDANNPAWNYMLYQRYTSVVDAFQNYTNVLGFFVGTDIPDFANETASFAFIKAAARDMKAYMKKKNYRSIPLGYATNDPPNDESLAGRGAAYLNCGDQDAAADFFALNILSWCANSTLESSRFGQKIQQFGNYSAPVFLAEYGCNPNNAGRNFSEVQEIYGSSMTAVFSGGIVYQYYADSNGTGLVFVVGDSVSISPDYSALSSQMMRVTPTSTNANSYTPSNTVGASCPSLDITFSASPTLPPVPYSRLCTCMMQTLSCVAAGNASSDATTQTLSTICAPNSPYCVGTQANGTTGSYGAFSVCNDTERASWDFNQHFLLLGGNDTACTQLGGMLQKPAKQEASDCSILLRQAGTDGTGTITSTPTAPTSTSGSSASGSGAGDSGLPTSVKAAIGTSIGLIAVLLCLVLHLLHLRQKQQRREKNKLEQDNTETGIPKAELADNQITPPQRTSKALLDGVELRELAAPEPAASELVAVNAGCPAELEAPHGASEVWSRASWRSSNQSLASLVGKKKPS